MTKQPNNEKEFVKEKVHQFEDKFLAKDDGKKVTVAGLGRIWYELFGMKSWLLKELHETLRHGEQRGREKEREELADKEQEKPNIRRNIGMLRQWLNEDRIKDHTKMVTNEDLERWLFREETGESDDDTEKECVYCNTGMPHLPKSCGRIPDTQLTDDYRRGYERALDDMKHCVKTMNVTVDGQTVKTQIVSSIQDTLLKAINSLRRGGEEDIKK